jgi:hypothetical protein
MVLVYGHLVSLLLGHGEAEHHGREHVMEQRCLSHGSQEVKIESKRKGPDERLITQRHATSDLITPIKPNLLIAHSAMKSLGRFIDEVS